MWKGSKNPFQRYARGFTMNFNEPGRLIRSSLPGKGAAIQKNRGEAPRQGVEIKLPSHLSPPEDAQTLDIRRLSVVPAGGTVDLMVYTARPGGYTRFTHYGIFNDALDATLVEIRPLLNGSRAYPNHGDPNDDFKMNLGLAPDLSDNSLIQAIMNMKDGDEIRWVGINNAAVDVTMGVRMKGYFDTTQNTLSGRFGG